ncbi:MAG: protoporphyrinogen oxidase [Salinibacterium sp.]|nr:MAG: protoporphyrinogen oxidase [Salinibacterium sp.]
MNPRLLLLGIGLGIGYVLGTRDGRARYDAMKAKVTALWEDPRVAKARDDVQEFARQQAPIIRERAEAVAKATPGVVRDTAKDVADKVSTTAKDVAAKASATAKDVKEKVADTASDVRDQAKKAASDLRSRGDSVVDGAVNAVGEARDRVMDLVDDDEDEPTI